MKEINSVPRSREKTHLFNNWKTSWGGATHWVLKDEESVYKGTNTVNKGPKTGKKSTFNLIECFIL